MGMIIFLLLCMTLLGLRVIIHIQSVDAAYDEVHLVINAHAAEIDESMDRYGASYVRDLVRSMSEDVRDKQLYLLFRTKGKVVGNFRHWPNLHTNKNGYSEITLKPTAYHPARHFLIKSIYYRNNSTLLVGYNLERVDKLRHDFVAVLAANVMLALIVSLTISTIIIWLLSRHFRQFNVACERIMAGNLDYRVSTQLSGDEFDMLASNINRMLDWNKTLIATVKDSTNAIAHDMRTPLSRLRLELRALSDRPRLDKETQKQVLEHVDRVDGLIEMFEHILNIAMAESRSSTELFEPVDMGQLLRDVLDFYAPIIEEKKLHLQANLPDVPLMLRGDKQLLGQAVVNLIDNACKYTPNGGTIDAALCQDSDAITLTLGDNGAGVAPELLEKVKERFFRADASRNTRGHGLGLSLVGAVATLHRGTLQLKDNHPGLCVELTLRGAILC